MRTKARYWFLEWPEPSDDYVHFLVNGMAEYDERANAGIACKECGTWNALEPRGPMRLRLASRPRYDFLWPASSTGLPVVSARVQRWLERIAPNDAQCVQVVLEQVGAVEPDLAIPNAWKDEPEDLLDRVPREDVAAHGPLYELRAARNVGPVPMRSVEVCEACGAREYEDLDMADDLVWLNQAMVARIGPATFFCVGPIMMMTDSLKQLASGERFTNVRFSPVPVYTDR